MVDRIIRSKGVKQGLLVHIGKFRAFLAWNGVFSSTKVDYPSLSSFFCSGGAGNPLSLYGLSALEPDGNSGVGGMGGAGYAWVYQSSPGFSGGVGASCGGWIVCWDGCFSGCDPSSPPGSGGAGALLDVDSAGNFGVWGTASLVATALGSLTMGAGGKGGARLKTAGGRGG